MSWRQRFNVEFVHLTPADGVRRPLSLALIATAFGMAIVAGLAFSAGAARLGKSDPVKSAATGEAIHSSSTGEAHGSGNSCADQTWPYLDSKCLSDTDPKAGRIRVIALTQSEASFPRGVGVDNVATRLAQDGLEKPQNIKQVQKSKRAREVYNNAGKSVAKSYWVNQAGVYPDRW